MGADKESLLIYADGNAEVSLKPTCSISTLTTQNVPPHFYNPAEGFLFDRGNDGISRII